MSNLFTFRLQGQTSTATAIGAGVEVSFDSDNVLRWVDSFGNKRWLSMDSNAGPLFTQLFTGAGGLSDTQPRPNTSLVSKPGDGVRTDS